MADPTLLVDSDVLIDFFRGSPQAADWLSANSDAVVGIPVVVLMEGLHGVVWVENGGHGGGKPRRPRV